MQQKGCASVTQSTHLAEVSLWGTLWENREDRLTHSTVGEIMGNTSCWLGFFVLSFLFGWVFFPTVQYFFVLPSLGHKEWKHQGKIQRPDASSKIFGLSMITVWVNSERAVVSCCA